jgi:hypothetical protein
LSGKFKNSPTLSSLLASKTSINSREKIEEDKKIARALSSLAKLHNQKQAENNWKALPAVQRRRHFAQHSDSGGGGAN